MRIFIESAIKDKNNLVTITGKTKIGNLSGIWKSNIEPVIGEDYDVELTLPPLCGNSIAVLEPNLQPMVIVKPNDKILFRGRCEMIDEDDVYIIRFDTNWIEMVEFESENVKINDVIEFLLSVDQIEVYPVN